MKRALVVALVVVLAALGAGCGGSDDGGSDDDASKKDDEKEQREDPRSALIADEALLTASDLPPWWSEVDPDPRYVDAWIQSTTDCGGVTAAELAADANKNARSGPVQFEETDGVRRIDLEIRTYPDEADAEAFLTELEASDALACIDTLLAALSPDGGTQPAAWGTPPPLGDQSLALVFTVPPGEQLPEEATYQVVWVRVGRAVAQLSYRGPAEDDPTKYIETVTTRLSEGLADT